MSSASVLHLGCGDDYHFDAHNVDVVPDVEPDEVADLSDYPWPWGDSSFEIIRAHHVFEHLEDTERTLRECERILEPGGRLVTKWPIGADALADPDHKHIWTWRTPLFYCGERHWDNDIGLTVYSRDVDLWPAGQQDRILSIFDKLRIRIRMRQCGPGPWCFVAANVSGEFTVVFEKP